MVLFFYSRCGSSGYLVPFPYRKDVYILIPGYTDIGGSFAQIGTPEVFTVTAFRTTGTFGHRTNREVVTLAVVEHIVGQPVEFVAVGSSVSSIFIRKTMSCCIVFRCIGRIELLHLLEEVGVIAQIECFLTAHASSANTEVHVARTENVQVGAAYKFREELGLFFAQRILSAYKERGNQRDVVHEYRTIPTYI